LTTQTLDSAIARTRAPGPKTVGMAAGSATFERLQRGGPKRPLWMIAAPAAVIVIAAGALIALSANSGPHLATPSVQAPVVADSLQPGGGSPAPTQAPAPAQPATASVPAARNVPPRIAPPHASARNAAAARRTAPGKAPAPLSAQSPNAGAPLPAAPEPITVPPMVTAAPTSAPADSAPAPTPPPVTTSPGQPVPN